MITAEGVIDTPFDTGTAVLDLPDTARTKNTQEVIAEVKPIVVHLPYKRKRRRISLVIDEVSLTEVCDSIPHNGLLRQEGRRSSLRELL